MFECDCYMFIDELWDAWMNFYSFFVLRIPSIADKFYDVCWNLWVGKTQSEDKKSSDYSFFFQCAPMRMACIIEH